MATLNNHADLCLAGGCRLNTAMCPIGRAVSFHTVSEHPPTFSGRFLFNRNKKDCSEMKNQLLIFVITLVIPLLMPELSYAGCREYVAGHCYRCVPGEWLYGSGCQPCPANATCNNGQTYTCNSGYYTFGPPGCEPCPANATCSGTSTVTCRSGYYRSDYNKCSPCPANATCTSSGFTCNTGYKKEGNSCVKGCPDGCSVCDGSTCKKCESNKFLYSNICFDCDTSTMICNGGALTCKDGYYKYGPPDCYACPENATCVSPGTLSCNEGYYQTNYAECSRCPTGCKTCSYLSYNVASCKTCYEGYTLEGNECVLAQTVNTCPSRMTLSTDGCCCLNK